MGLAPVAYPDPESPCPAGRTGWRLEVLDRRMTRESSDGVVSLIGDSIRRSFPGCRWDSNAGSDAGVLRVEIHRFATNPAGNTWDAEAGADAGVLRIEIHRFATTPGENTWDAAAEWTVSALDAAGATLTEFETNEEVSRPNYRGSNNATESLREVFDRALRRTLAGLRVVSAAGVSPSPGEDAGPGRTPAGEWLTGSVRGTSADAGVSPGADPLEHFSLLSSPEVL